MYSDPVTWKKADKFVEHIVLLNVNLSMQIFNGIIETDCFDIIMKELDRSCLKCCAQFLPPCGYITITTLTFEAREYLLGKVCNK